MSVLSWPVLRTRLRHRWGLLAVVVVLSLLGAAMTLVQPLLLGQAMDQAARGSLGGTTVWLLTCVLLLAGLLAGARELAVQRLAEDMVYSLRTGLVDRIMRLPIAELDRRRHGDLVSRVTTDTTVVRTALVSGMTTLFGGVVLLVGGLVGMILTSVPLFLATAFAVALATGSVVTIAGRVERAGSRAQQAVGDLASALTRVLQAMRTVRAFGADRQEMQAIERRARRARTAGRTMAGYIAVINPVSTTTIQLCFLVIVGLGGWMVSQGSMEVAALVQFLLFLFILIAPLSETFSALTAWSQAKGALARIQDIESLPAESDAGPFTGAALGISPPGDREATACGGLSVEFRGVTFGYPGPMVGSSLVLREVDLHIRPGEFVAVVGPSGAGKSTLLSLVERFYDPLEGQVLVDGADLRSLSHGDVRSKMALVEQSSPVLAGSIRDNLLLGEPGHGEPGHGERDCRRVLDRLGLLPVVDRHPDGLDAPVGEGGIALSGGERQRLALARALLRRPRLLLLDESTSSLDGLSESVANQAVRAAAEYCTVVVVAHRLASVQHADRILLMDQGKIVASGRHEELVRDVPLYQELASFQMLA